MNCQFCGAGESDRNESGSWVGFDCLSTWRKDCDPKRFQSRDCQIKEVQDLKAENTRLRAALANSQNPCVYCSLPKEQWAACKSGFPGCSRSDDAMGCPELGAMLQLNSANERIAALETAGDALWVALAYPPMADSDEIAELLRNWDKVKGDK